eukprot:Em0013g551a
MNSLNELFDQILRSEQSFRERLDKLRELSSKVQDLQLELKALREEVESIEGELVLKNQKLADAETEAKIMKVWHDVLSTQARELQLVEETSEKNLEEAAYKLSTLRREFVDELKEFGHSYDLCGLGTRYREDVARRQIKDIQNEILLLEAELVQIDAQRDSMEKLQREIGEIQVKLSEDRKQEQDLKDRLAQQDREWKELQQEKEALAIKFSKDPELIKIQNELDCCLHCVEEEQCRGLEKELEALQRQCYQKQMRQQLSLQQRGRREGRGADPPMSGTKWMPPEEEILELRAADEDLLGGEEKGWDSKQVESRCQKDEIGDVGLSKEELAALEVEEEEVGGDNMYLDFDSQELFEDEAEKRVEWLDYPKKKDALCNLQRRQTPQNATISACVKNDQMNLVGSHTLGEWERTRSAQLKQVCSSSTLESKAPPQVSTPAPHWELQRKKPGQSIYKAPGNQSRAHNGVKKVRFHY